MQTSLAFGVLIGFEPVLENPDRGQSKGITLRKRSEEYETLSKDVLDDQFELGVLIP